MNMNPLFKDRAEAGKVLAEELHRFANRENVLILALPRGGVPVAFELAKALHAPTDVFLVRKLGVPGHEELAMGALASGGLRVLNREVVEQLGISPEAIETVAADEMRELERRESEYRRSRPRFDITGRDVILVDDGLATGASMRAAAAALRQRLPKSITIAVPVGSAETCRLLEREVDEVVCARTPDPFHAVGIWYQDFRQVSDDEVTHLLDLAAESSEGALESFRR